MQFPTTRIKMMKWECKTQLLSHTYFATEKKANLLFCKSKIIEKNICFLFRYCLSHSEQRYEPKKKHWA